MTRRYWVEVDGRRLYRATLGEVKRLAHAAADQLGRAVSVGYDTPARTPKRRTLKRNPVMRGHDYTGEEWKLTARGPHGAVGVAYCGSEAEAEDAKRVLRARGWRVTHLVRLAAPNAPPKRRRGR